MIDARLICRRRRMIRDKKLFDDGAAWSRPGQYCRRPGWRVGVRALVVRAFAVAIRRAGYLVDLDVEGSVVDGQRARKPAIAHGRHWRPIRLDGGNAGVCRRRVRHRSRRLGEDSGRRAGAQQRCPPPDAPKLSVIERQTNHSAPFAPLRMRDSAFSSARRRNPTRCWLIRQANSLTDSGKCRVNGDLASIQQPGSSGSTRISPLESPAETQPVPAREYPSRRHVRQGPFAFREPTIRGNA